MKCPKCGGDIEHDETYDSSTDCDTHIDFCCGHCEECGTEYQWKEVYEYIAFKELEELR